jgi:hypothetical protein
MKTCFITVCGGGEDYEFLLGAIEHHAKLGMHLVLDTTPLNRGARSFRNLPGSVLWVYEPNFGAGWGEFKFATALNRATFLAELMLASGRPPIHIRGVGVASSHLAGQERDLLWRRIPGPPKDDGPGVG